jgi:23S rRNA pseudouridine2457 synthase
MGHGKNAGAMLVAFNKPCGVLSRFTPEGSSNRTLAEFGFPSGIYPLGRLDADSEGLLLLSDEAGLNGRLMDPRAGHPRTYWALVERRPDAEALDRLRGGVEIAGGRTRPCRAWVLDPPPDVAPRVPPVRYRKTVEDVWVGIVLEEGKNRQVRRMTAAVGLPTLRLVRWSIGEWTVAGIAPGQFVEFAA